MANWCVGSFELFGKDNNLIKLLKDIETKPKIKKFFDDYFETDERKDFIRQLKQLKSSIEKGAKPYESYIKIDYSYRWSISCNFGIYKTKEDMKNGKNMIYFDEDNYKETSFYKSILKPYKLDFKGSGEEPGMGFYEKFECSGTRDFSDYKTIDI